MANARNISINARLRAGRHVGGRTGVTMNTRTRMVWLLLVCTLALVLQSEAAEQTNWAQFRGPTMNSAVADHPDLPEQWSQTNNVEWVTDIPELGWSSPIVWGTKVFVTTVTSEGEFEKPKPGLYAPRGRSEPPQARHDWRVYCLDLETGDILWMRSVKSDVPDFPRHQKNTYASETLSLIHI